ncbi:MAG: TIGR04086 family membrane protein [Bacillota bacterium]|nr:TIGR04086 family membrane protein [Bacillota bacterium]
MEQKAFLTKVSKGVFRAAVITTILLVVYAIVMTVTEVSNQVTSVYYLLVTCLSVIYGSIYAARKNNKNGWLVGMLVALLYMLLLYIIARIVFGYSDFGTKELLRMAIAVMVGALSGMLGINI